MARLDGGSTTTLFNRICSAASAYDWNAIASYIIMGLVMAVFLGIMFS